MTAFVDTNVLLYAIRADSAEAGKRDIATSILDRSQIVLSVQVLNEFIWQAVWRQARPISKDRAFALLQSWRRHRTILLDLDILDMAARIARRTNYSWWDCLIVAAAVVAGCDILYTEDMQHGRVIDGVRIDNPFRDVA